MQSPARWLAVAAVLCIASADDGPRDVPFLHPDQPGAADRFDRLGHCVSSCQPVSPLALTPSACQVACADAFED